VAAAEAHDPLLGPPEAAVVHGPQRDRPEGRPVRRRGLPHRPRVGPVRDHRHRLVRQLDHRRRARDRQRPQRVPPLPARDRRGPVRGNCRVVAAGPVRDSPALPARDLHRERCQGLGPVLVSGRQRAPEQATGPPHDPARASDRQLVRAPASVRASCPPQGSDLPATTWETFWDFLVVRAAERDRPSPHNRSPLEDDPRSGRGRLLERGHQLGRGHLSVIGRLEGVLPDPDHPSRSVRRTGPVIHRLVPAADRPGTGASTHTGTTTIGAADMIPSTGGGGQRQRPSPVGSFTGGTTPSTTATEPAAMCTTKTVSST